MWAYAESPLIDGDVLVCTPGGAEATLVALNKKTGDVIWKSAVPGGDEAAYASVIVATVAGVKQYVQFLQKGLVGVDAKTGKFLWRYDQHRQRQPGQHPDAGRPRRLRLHRHRPRRRWPGQAHRQTRIEQSRSRSTSTTSCPPPSAARCWSATTSTARPARCWSAPTSRPARSSGPTEASGAGSLCYADGRLYLHGENGDVGARRGHAGGYREKGRFTPPDQPDRGQSKAWAYPVVANGRLYIRDFGVLWCYDVKTTRAVN